VVVFGVIIVATNHNNNIKQQKSVTHSKIIVKDSSDTQKLAALTTAVDQVINANSGIDFEVSSLDITNGNNQISFGDTNPMTAASVSKIITATDFLNQVQNGAQSMSEVLEDGNTVSYDLQQMIVVSDDDSWDALNDVLTYPQLQRYSVSIGVTSEDWPTNTLTASDTANLLAKLYEGKLLNRTYTNLVLGYMKQANYRQYMVPAIPSYDTIYHKIGLYDDDVNDAAIITNGKQTVSLVVFTNGNGDYDWPNRAIMIQQITKAFLTYYGLD